MKLSQKSIKLDGEMRELSPELNVPASGSATASASLLVCPATRAKAKRHQSGKSSGIFVLQAFCATLIASGCSTMPGAVSVADLESRFGAAQAHWIGTPVQLTKVLYLGLIQDPSTTGGKLVPTSFGNAGVEDSRWFTKVGLKRLDVFLRPEQTPSPIDFGPGPTEPTGIYAYELRARPNPECKSYDAAMDRYRKVSAVAGRPFKPFVSQDQCLSYRYIGPLEFTEAPYIYVNYFDALSDRQGYGVFVYEIRAREGQVIARAMACFSNYRLRVIGNCKGNNTIFDLYP